MHPKIRPYAKALISFLALYQVANLTACSTAEVADLAALANADFGDAPDNLPSGYGSGMNAQFPSRFSSQGAHHLNTSDSALGAMLSNGSLPVTTENDATDPMDSDGIQNIDQPIGASNLDKLDDGLLTTTFAPGSTNQMSFLVSVATGAPSQTRYVNVLVDWNQDGVWSGSDANGAPEWAVQNMPVNVPPGMSLPFTSPDFLAGLLTQNVWMRLTLSDTTINPADYPAGWDGTGEYATGETEDYFLQDHVALVLPDKNGGGGGGPKPPPPPPFPPVGGGGGGGGGGGNNCEFWKAYNVTLCKGQSRRFLALVGGFAPDKVTATSNDPGVASVEVNEANVTINTVGEGDTTIDVTVVDGDCVYHITVHVKVKKCEPKPKIECCTPAEIAKDPSRCKNCHVVGWKIHTNETPGGGGSSADGSIEETGSHGDTSDGLPTKSTVVVIGNVIKIVTTYYKCDPCPEPDPKVDLDGDGIPNEDDWYPEECYNPDEPSSYEEQLYVDSFFDVFFDVNNDHGIFDQKFFQPPEETVKQPGVQVNTQVGGITISR